MSLRWSGHKHKRSEIILSWCIEGLDLKFKELGEGEDHKDLKRSGQKGMSDC